MKEKSKFTREAEFLLTKMTEHRGTKRFDEVQHLEETQPTKDLLRTELIAFETIL